MPGPISLIERRDAPADAGVVQLLEKALQEAKDGRLKSVLILKVERLGNWQSVWDGTMLLTQLIGILECAKHDLLCRERERPPVGDDPA